MELVQASKKKSGFKSPHAVRNRLRYRQPRARRGLGYVPLLTEPHKKQQRQCYVLAEANDSLNSGKRQA